VSVAGAIGFEAGARQLDAELRLTPFDAQFLAAEAGTMYSHYCGMTVFGPRADGCSLTRDDVEALVASRLDRIPPLRWRLRSVPLGLDHPRFVDGPVDLGEHIVGHHLAPPGDLQQLARLGARIMSRRLDRSRPLWAFHVVEGLADGRTAVGLTFHHAAADALGAAAIASLLLDPTDDPDARELPGPVPVRRAPGTGRTLARSLTRAVTHPVGALRSAAQALPHLDQVPMMRTLPGAAPASRLARATLRTVGRDQSPAPELPAAPRLRFNGPLSPSRSVAFATVEKALVLDVKRRHGVSYNDVVMAAIAGGLRRHLGATGELPDRPLLAFVPANVRAEGQRLQGNAISSFVVPIPTDRPDAVDRLQEASLAMRRAKARHQLTPPTLMDDANNLIPPMAFGVLAGGMLRLLGSGWIAPPLNLLISNVPGPPRRVHLAGAPMEAFYPMSLVFGGAALNVTVMTYADRVDLGLVGDAVLVPDAAEILAAIEDEFRALASR